MKRILTLVAALALTAGCASFTTTQTDTSYDTNGQPARAITTKVKVRTLFDANSALAKSKASNTDKAQTAELGGLNQSSNTTNAVAALLIISDLAKSAAAAAK